MTSENESAGDSAPVEPTDRGPSAPAASPPAAGSDEAAAAGVGPGADDGGGRTPDPAGAPPVVPPAPQTPPEPSSAPVSPAPPEPSQQPPSPALQKPPAPAPAPAPGPGPGPGPGPAPGASAAPAAGQPAGSTPEAGAGTGGPPVVPPTPAGMVGPAPSGAPGAGGAGAPTGYAGAGLAPAAGAGTGAAAGGAGASAGGGATGLGAWTAFPGPPPPPPRRGRGGLIAGIVAVTLVAGGLGGYGGFLLADNTSDTSPSTPQGGDSEPPERSPESVAGIADDALPSVVTLQAEEGQEGGTGTGFVYDEDGHIVTNNHVVAEAADGGTVTATFSDGESYEAEVVGGAQGYDIAVLRLDDVGDRELTPLPMGDSDEVVVGDATVAIGAPFGLSGTVTTGIISAQDRPVASSDGMGGAASYMSALQTDASINPGNSGGPLLDASGAVIGVNSAIQSNSGVPGQQAGSVGLGFAIPVNQADRVAQDLIEDGEPIYAVIGVTVDMSENTTGGAQVVEEGEDGRPAVPPGGPAADAGLEPGDVITQFGDRVIDSGPTLISEIWTYEPGETVELTYLRDGEENTASLTLDSRVGDQE